jgi:acyl-coenzyme A thioesterase PaaI-like protein
VWRTGHADAVGHNILPMLGFDWSTFPPTVATRFARMGGPHPVPPARLGHDMLEARRLGDTEAPFDLDAAARLLTEVLAPWVRDLELRIETVDTARPSGAAADWQPGAALRLPRSPRICRDDGAICTQALTALAEAAMTVAAAAVWNGYRPMSPIDQTMHVLRPATTDVIADARIVRTGRTTCFGRVVLSNATDRRPIGMVASACAVL